MRQIELFYIEIVRRQMIYFKFREVHAFHKSINPKLDITTRLEFELAHYGVAVQNVSHCTTGTTHIYAYMYISVCVCVCVCVFIKMHVH